MPATSESARPSGRPAPRSVERPLGADEIFFSTTDHKGVIRSGNRLFSQVSGYARHELIGRPHSIIRHPDMPRVVFKLLWDVIQAGRPVAAYVKNLAKDGAYYWVLATVVPCEGGYLSVRVKPATGCFSAAQAIYQDLLAVEQEIEQGDPRRREQAMAASAERLSEALRGAGFADYAAFMRAALLAEVKERACPCAAGDGAPAGAQTTHDGGTLWSMLEAFEGLGTFLSSLVARLDSYVSLSELLSQKVEFASELGEDVQLFSFNALLGASRMKAQGTALGKVSMLMQARSDEISPVFGVLADDVSHAADLVGRLLLPVVIARFQVEAAITFVQELLEGRDDEAATADDLVALTRCLADEVNGLGGSLAELDGRLRALVDDAEQLRRALRTIRALELNGRVEAARATGADGVVTLFRTIAATIERARGELDELRHAGRFSFAWEIREIERNRAHVDRVRAAAGALARSGSRTVR